MSLPRPYSLTLTCEERKAIEWVGFRDWNGDEFRSILEGGMGPDYDGDEWYSDDEFKFKLSEADAWTIRECAEEYGIPHFADSLASKVRALVDSIV